MALRRALDAVLSEVARVRQRLATLQALASIESKSDPYGGLPFPTCGVSLGKEKVSRIDARIFPNQWFARRKHTAKKESKCSPFLLVTRTGLEAILKNAVSFYFKGL